MTERVPDLRDRDLLQQVVDGQRTDREADDDLDDSDYDCTT